MSESRINAGQLRGQRWRETVHELLRTVDEPVDPLVERAGEEVTRRYRSAGDFEDLSRARVAEVINLLDDRDLSRAERWLLRQPYVLVRALEWAQRQEPSDDEGLATGVVEFVEREAVPLLARLLVREATRPEAPHPAVDELDLQPGEVDEQDLVDKLLERGPEIRAGRALDEVSSAITDSREAGRAAERKSEEQFPERHGRNAVRDFGKDLAAIDAESRTSLHDLCDFSLPKNGPRWASYQAHELLRFARIVSFLYIATERRPMFAAMDALHEQVTTTGLLTAHGGRRTKDGRFDDGICKLHIHIFLWGHQRFPLAVEQRAAAAAAVGIRDDASCVPPNAEFSRAMEQVVQLLATLATSRPREAIRWVRPAVRVASLKAAGALEGAITGETLSTIGLWRRQYELADMTLTDATLRGLLGVASDPAEGPGPAIQKLVPDALFDPQALAEEWRALRRIFRLIRRAASPQRCDDIRKTVLLDAIDAAVTLLVLKGRFHASSRDMEPSGARR